MLCRCCRRRTQAERMGARVSSTNSTGSVHFWRTLRAGSHSMMPQTNGHSSGSWTFPHLKGTRCKWKVTNLLKSTVKKGRKAPGLCCCKSIFATRLPEELMLTDCHRKWRTTTSEGWLSTKGSGNALLRAWCEQLREKWLNVGRFLFLLKVHWQFGIFFKVFEVSLFILFGFCARLI